MKPAYAAPATYPYTLRVEMNDPPGGSARWIIYHGRSVFQRSDRDYPTETEARTAGAETLERLLKGYGAP